VKPARFQYSAVGWRSKLWMVREIVFCVAAPAVLLLGADLVAQKTMTASSQHSTTQSDDQIANAINNKLMASNTLRPLDLGVWVHDGTATLSGTVPNASLKQQAEALVHSVAGVKSVDDKLGVGDVSLAAPGFPAHPGSTTGQNPAVAVNSAQPARVYSQPQTQQPMQQTPGPQPYRMQQPAMPMLTVAPQTPLYVMMMQTVDSHHTQPGTGFRGMVVQDIVLSNGVIAVPRGALVEGTVIDARPPGHLKGHPELALQLSSVNIGRARYVLSSYVWAQRGPGKGGETASAVAGGAGFGAITGAIVGGGPAALLGAAIGGLGGAGLSALTSGPHLMVPAESIVAFHLSAPLTVREPTANEVRMLASNLPPPRYYRRPRYPAPVYSPPGYPPPEPGAPPGGYPY